MFYQAYFYIKACFEQFMLTIKFIFAYYQMCFCLLPNVNMIAVKFVFMDSDLWLCGYFIGNSRSNQPERLSHSFIGGVKH